MFKAINGYALSLQPTLELERLDFNLDNSLLKDEKIRAAIALVIDKKHICQSLLNGAVLQTANYIAPYSALYNAEIDDKRDVPAAKALLSGAAWVPGADGIMTKAGVRLSFGLSVSDDDVNRMVIAENIVASLREIGVEATIVKIPAKNFTNLMTTGNFQAALYTFMMYPDFSGNLLWSSQQIPAATNGYSGKNFSRLKDLRIDKLFSEISGPRIAGSEKPNVLLIQKYLSVAMPGVPLFYYQAANVVRNDLKNFKPGTVFASEYRNAYLWEW